MHNYEQKVLLIYDGASPRLSHLNGSLFPRLGRFREAPAPGVMSQSRLSRGFEKEVGQIRLISQMGYYLECVGRRGRVRRYEPRDSALRTNELTARAEAVAPHGGKAPTRGQI